MTGEFRSGWLMLLGATVGVGLGVSSLPFYTAGLFITPLMTEFGWTRGAVAAGNLALSIGIGLGAVMVGPVMDRFGIRKVVAVALVLQAVLYSALSLIDGSLARFLSLIFALGFFGAGSSPLAFTKIVNAHFVRARGLALGICLMGTGLIATLAPPILSRVIAAYGWQVGYLVLSGAVLGGVAFTFVLKAPDPQSGKANASQPVSSGFLNDPRFWFLGMASALAASSVAGMVVHFVPILIAKGASPISAASAASLIGVAVIVARLCFGAAIDRAPPAFMGAIMMSVAALGVFFLYAGSLEISAVAALTLGAALGAEIDLISFLTARYFGLAAYGRIYGLVYGTTLLAAGAGPFLIGLIADQTGGYDPALLVDGGFLLLSAALLLRLWRIDTSP